MCPDSLERVWMIYNCTKCTKSCKNTFCAHLSQIYKLTRFTRFIRKVFATKILLSGKFSLFVTLIEHCTGWLISGSALLCSWQWCNWGDKQRDHAAEWSDIDLNRERLCALEASSSRSLLLFLSLYLQFRNEPVTLVLCWLRKKTVPGGCRKE